MTRLGQGKDQRFYVVPDAEDLRGKGLWLRAEQANGPPGPQLPLEGRRVRRRALAAPTGTNLSVGASPADFPTASPSCTSIVYLLSSIVYFLTAAQIPRLDEPFRRADCRRVRCLSGAFRTARTG